MTAEQLEASRAERLRHNGHGHLTIDDARTWLEETGLCLFLPKKQFSFVAPSFVEAVAGERNPAPPAKIVSLAEDLLVRLETEGVAVRLNLQGTPGEQPDYVVAAWVLPYVYALRGDRDWRRIPQLTGSRQVSPLAVQTFKLLESGGDASISQLKHTLGREVTESGVLRGITELWQQLRIIPVIAAPGKPARWQLLRVRFQKAIAEGASTSQVTAISVLASIYLQAVIAAPMEEVELFLAALTARSKVREVLRGLLATRQVHTISLGHAPHFYVAGTLPEFAPAPTSYASSSMPASTSFLRSYEPEEDRMSTSPSPAITLYSAPPSQRKAVETPAPAAAASVPAPVPAPAPKPITSEKKPVESRPHFSHKPARPHSRKPATASSGNRAARREVRSAAPRPKGTSRHTSSARWSQGAAKNGHSQHSGSRSAKSSGGHGHLHSNGNGHAGRSANGSRDSRNGKPTETRHSGTSRKDARSGKRNTHGNRKPTLTASAKAGSRGRYGFTVPAKQRSKKRG